MLPNGVAAPGAHEAHSRQATKLSHNDADAVLALVAHELRTPLTVLLGQAQLLRRRMDERADTPPADRKTANILVEQTRRLSTLLDTLFDVTQAEHGQLRIMPTPLDFGALVRRVVEELQPALHSHTLRLYTEPGRFWVAGDVLRLEQVLLNLLQNAVKYSLPGGIITVQLTPHGDQVRLAVSDNGLGVAASVRPLLFQRFVRAEQSEGRPVSGLGLGLYLCKALMDLHSGSIQVESVEGMGSTFILLLPQLVRG